jgi:hypothetical protein
MKVYPNRDIAAARPVLPTTKAIASPGRTQADFSAATQLAQELAATPETRADQVARAKALIADPNYPDAETIRRIAHQMVGKIVTPPAEE